MIKAIAKAVIPMPVQRSLERTVKETSTSVRLNALRRRMLNGNALGTGELQNFLGFTMRINDWSGFYAIYKDVYAHGIYYFRTSSPKPLILDCGSNIGGTILYFKKLHPDARVLGFEPDPVLFPYLEENISRNKLRDVQLIQAALTKDKGHVTFYSDSKSSSFVPNDSTAPLPRGWKKYSVPTVRLRDYLVEPVDFMKMNIEGAEWEVLADCEDRIEAIQQIVIEYHHLPGLPRTLHNILDLLHRHGYEYLINHFDYDTNPGLRPPFRLKPESRYWLLIYATRLAAL